MKTGSFIDDLRKNATLRVIVTSLCALLFAVTLVGSLPKPQTISSDLIKVIAGILGAAGGYLLSMHSLRTH
jgi:hypothetical protein